MYVRMVTSYVHHHQLAAMTDIYRRKLLPMIENQPGFKGIFVFNDPDCCKEVSITLWERLVDMEAFNVNLLALKDDILPLLEKAPEVEIFQVVVPEDLKDLHPALSESSLGVRIGATF